MSVGLGLRTGFVAMDAQQAGQRMAIRGLRFWPDGSFHNSDGGISQWEFNYDTALNNGPLLREASMLMVAHATGLGLSYRTIAGQGKDHSLITAVALGNSFETDFAITQRIPWDRQKFRLVGPDLAARGGNTLVIASYATEGQHLVETVKLARQAGMVVKDAMVLVDGGEEKARTVLDEVGVHYHPLYRLQEQTGRICPTDELADNLFRLQQTELHRIREAVLGANVLKLGQYRFAGGQESDNKIDMEEIYKHSKVLRLVLQALGKLAIPYRPDCIVPIANGADQLGVHLGVWLDLPVAFLQKDKVEPGLKTFKFRTDGDRQLVVASKNIIIIEDTPNRRTSSKGALELPELRLKARAVLGVWDRALPGEAMKLPVPEAALVTEPLPYKLPSSHSLYRHAIPDPDPEQQQLAATRKQ